VIVPQIGFWMLAGFTAVATLGVVVTRNVVHSALALAASLLGAAGLFILFGAEFVGLAQILIYVGAVVILFLFGIMLTSASAGRPVIDNEQPGVAALVALGVFVVLAIGIIGSYGRRRLSLDVAFSTTKLGTALFTRWILPFEAVSVLLLAALIGAIVLARKD
jgi:NADH-quinone oxidoreductase subunit J